jgi:hypothetical protein
MTQTELNGEYVLEADRKLAAFRSVPEETKELIIKTLEPSEAAELLSLGHRLKYLTKLTLRYGLLEHLDFLESFHSIQTLNVSHLNDLKNYTGIGYCVKLTGLSLTPSLSSIGSLGFLRCLPELERVHLEGPNPSKGFDEIQPLRKVQKLSLYAPRWSIERLPVVFPALEDLYISQGGYRSLDFIATLEDLKSLDIYYARKLTTFDAIGRLPRLRTFRIGHAITGLQSCSQFGCSSTVEHIEITACKQLKDISSLLVWSALKTAKIYDCPLISDAQIEILRKAGKIVNGK